MAVEVNGKTQIVVNATNKIRAYDLETGDVVWECGGMTGNVIPSPVADFGMVFCMSGFRGNALKAIRYGEAPETRAGRWRSSRSSRCGTSAWAATRNR